MCKLSGITQQSSQQQQVDLQENENVSQNKFLIVETYLCQFCQKKFKTKKTCKQHQDNHCKLNEKLSLEKLAKLLNQKQDEIDRSHTEMKCYQQKIDGLEIQINKLINKFQIQNIGNINNFHADTINDNSTNTNTNINVLNYNQTDYDFLTPRDFLRCFQDNNHCVKTLIEKVHFNKKHPENMNIYISCLKGKYVMVYKENKWQIFDRKKQIDYLYNTNELVLENWYDEYSEKYPHIIKSFNRYLKNKDEDDELLTNVKQEILMMLYNKRDMIPHNNKSE